MARKSDSSSGPQLTTLYAKDGREYQTASLPEITRLKAAGYSETPPPKEEAEVYAKAEAAAVAGPPPPPIVGE
jgi:hypothetical protein